MSLEVIGLGRLLQCLCAAPRMRRALLQRDIRSERKKAAGGTGGTGGDFYGPFWADARRHASGDLDLRQITPTRIAANPVSRQRLYPALAEGFLVWWEQKRRFRNEPFQVNLRSMSTRYSVDGIGTIKIENTLSMIVGEDRQVLVCPYLSEKPELNENTARIGLWVIINSFPDFSPAGVRILDVLRSRSFSVDNVTLVGDEEARLRTSYKALLAERRAMADRPD